MYRNPCEWTLVFIFPSVSSLTLSMSSILWSFASNNSKNYLHLIITPVLWLRWKMTIVPLQDTNRHGQPALKGHHRTAEKWHLFSHNPEQTLGHWGHRGRQHREGPAWWHLTTQETQRKSVKGLTPNSHLLQRSHYSTTLLMSINSYWISEWTRHQ